MVEKAPIGFLDMLVKKGLQLVYVDSKQGGRKWETLFHPNAATDELK